MSKSIWVILIMGVVLALVLAVGMMVTLGQFSETPALEWVRLAEAIKTEFKAHQVGVRVSYMNMPSVMRVNYVSGTDSKFNSSVQNSEMEAIANFALKNYKGRDLSSIDQVAVTRSEIHGSGCFQQTYVAKFELANPRRVSAPPTFSLPQKDR